MIIQGNDINRFVWVCKEKRDNFHFNYGDDSVTAVTDSFGDHLKIEKPGISGKYGWQ